MGAALAIVVFFVIAGVIDYEVISGEPGGQPLTGLERALLVVPMMLVGLAAPVVGVVLSIRSARSGNRSGGVAAAISAAILVALATWWLMTGLTM